jgi:hypothetical protein
MHPISARAIVAAVLLVVVAGCAGKPQHPPIALSAGDPHSTNPDRIICRQQPAPTGSHIQQDARVCHTWAQWQQIEKNAQSAIRRGQRTPGQGNRTGPGI